MSQMIHFWSMTTTAQNVRNYLRNKPYLLEALEKGIVNLSELSDKSKWNSKQATSTATKAALRRFAEELQKHKQKREEKVSSTPQAQRHSRVRPKKRHHNRQGN